MNEPNSAAVGESRRLTVSRSVRDLRCSGWSAPRVREVPFLRLRGVWLERAGFPAGSRVQVDVERGRLVVTPESPEA